MKILAIGLLLPFLTLQVEAAQSECWASNSKLSKKFKCCEKSKVKETNEYGEWGDENGTCAIKKKAYNIVPEFSNIPEFEISQPKLPDNYCWTLYANANDGNKYPCCKNSKAKMQAFEMDGFLGVENNSYCGIKGYHALWNDREKFVKTKNQWNNFKSKWDKNYKSNFERISVFVGEDESKLNFGWYSTSNSKPKIRFGSKKDLSDAKDFTGTNSYYKTLNGKKYYSNKVTVTGLKRKSTYYYRRNLNGKWEETIRFNTYDPNNFQFIFVGDPQIGGSHDRLSVADPYHVLTREEGTRNDAFNWNMTIYKSFEKTGKPSVLLSAGDQVDTECFSGTTEEDYSQEIQYSAFLLPDLLKTIPSATTVGNHEALNKNYRNHYNTPNSHIPLEPEIAPGYSYFFKYNNVLVVVLETNYSFCDDFKAVFKKAFLKYPNTDWRVAMFHHDIYGNGSFHSQDEYIINKLRPCLTELLSYYKFDLVINGHDHIFSASKFVSYKKGNKYSLSNIQKGKVNKNAKGTFYITANCSTGSKLFGFINQDFDYNYNFSQTYTSAFGVLDFQKSNGKVKLTVNYYEVDTLRQIDGPYIFEKPEKCWASSLGFPCCQSSKVVFRTDSNGSWSLENDEWCGIIEEDIPIDNSPIVSKVEVPKPDTCWAYQLGYKCCKKSETVEVESGYGVLNGNWCGIIDDNNFTTPPPIQFANENNDSKTCWAELLGYNCCKSKNPIIIQTDEYGDWAIEKNNWCGIPGSYHLEDINPNDDSKCWAKSLGYKCCTSKAIYYASDNDGDWGIENDDWCGIIKGTHVINGDQSSSPTTSGQCWAKSLGFKCCTGSKPTVVYTDNNGDWSVENDEWCGIIKNGKKVTTTTTSSKKSEPTNGQCWAKKIGYECCKDSKTYAIYTDNNGDWGVENEVWCGIIKKNNSKNQNCWANKFGYDCCKSGAVFVTKDSDGDWGIENGKWCGFKKNIQKSNNNKKKT